MSVFKGLAGPALIYTLTNAFSAGVPFLMLPILTRLLTPDQYGIVAMFGLTVTVLGAFTGLSVHGVVGIRYFEQDRYDLPSYVTTCLLILLGSTTAVFLVVWFFTSLLVSVTKVPPLWLHIAVIVSGAQFVFQILLVLYQSSRQTWCFAVFRVGQTLTEALVSLICVIGLGLSWQGRLGGIAFAAIVFMVVALLALRSRHWLIGQADKGYAANALKFGVPLIPHVIGGMLIVMVDRFLISNLLDVGSTGIYMVAMQIGMVLGLLTDAFNRAFSPWLIESLKKDDPVRDGMIVRYTYLYFVALSVVALLLGLSAPYVLLLLVGPKYQAAASIVVYIAIGFAFGGMYYMVTNYIFYAGKTHLLAIITFSSGLFNLVATYYLLRVNGLVGAGQAFMLSQAITFFGTWWLAHRSRRMPWIQALKS